ncbi:MucR family transcriptional regulator [Humitalea sp. 24SJ18S-53]|uniref:MucR family transcriptional regulator n=1 Tax=Humitalea sp. 24SJ18S-53 TaxID=3422307 RepID=UPI003D66591C
MSQDNSPDLLGLTVDIVSAHVSHNPVGMADLPSLIQQVHKTLASLGTTATTIAVPAPVEKPQPAVSVKKSIQDDHLVCLEDGKKLKMLKRHLKTSYNLSPEQYREKWGLPADYPMVAPAYARTRSALAKQIGLGTKPKAARDGSAD